MAGMNQLCRNVLGQACGSCHLSESSALVRVSSSNAAAASASAEDEVARLRRELDAAERRRFVDALDQCAGNQTRAAKLLGISRTTLVNKLTHYRIPRPRP